MSEELIVIDYQKCIQNLTDILIDPFKFADMSKNIYDAIDVDNLGTLQKEQIEVFVKDFLKGQQIEGQVNTSFHEVHDEVFKILNDNETGELTFDELSVFLRELLKNQVIELQKRLEN